MSNLAIIDSSIYIENFRNSSYKNELCNLPYLVRNSSVVIAELYRGCRREKERKVIEELAETFSLVTPSEKVWKESGELLSHLSEDKGYTPEKIRDIHFDCLIALSARSIGATVITLNKNDFLEIKKYKNFKLICWEV